MKILSNWTASFKTSVRHSGAVLSRAYEEVKSFAVFTHLEADRGRHPNEMKTQKISRRVAERMAPSNRSLETRCPVAILTTLFALVFICSCGASHINLRYPPVRWFSDTDNAPVVNYNLIKKGLHEEYETKTVYIDRMIRFTEELKDFSDFTTLSNRHEASDLNNFDEVADSTWFTNKIGRFGKDFVYTPPTVNIRPPLTVLSMQKEGSALVNDSTGKSFFLRLDAKNEKEISTAKEFIAANVLSVIGYNVPNSTIMSISRKDLNISPGSIFKISDKKKRALTKGDVDNFFGATTRGLAIEVPQGHQLGVFSFQGKRKHDPNDRISHEHRRELRALIIFSVFMDLSGASDENTLDVFVPVDGTLGYIRHYVSNIAKPFTDKSSMANGDLQVKKWKFNVDTPAFGNLTRRDGFWAAKVLTNLSDDLIAQIVNSSGISSQGVKDRLIINMIERRDRIVGYWFSKLSPLDNFTLTQNGDEVDITFDDLAVLFGLRKTEDMRYRARLENLWGKKIFTDWIETDSNKFSLGSEYISHIENNEIVTLRIQPKKLNSQYWDQSVDVYLKRDGGNVVIYGWYKRFLH